MEHTHRCAHAHTNTGTWSNLLCPFPQYYPQKLMIWLEKEPSYSLFEMLGELEQLLNKNNWKAQMFMHTNETNKQKTSYNFE